MEKNLKSIISVSAVVIIAAVSVYTIYDLNGHSLDLSDRQVKVIVTGSMDGEPQPYEIEIIPVNSLVMIENLHYNAATTYNEVIDDLKVGDVLAFNSGGILITHRIISINESTKTITTKGDTNSGSETVAFKNVVGKVVGVNHWLGVVVHILQTYTISVILATIGLVSGYVAVQSSMQIIREEKEAEARKAEDEKDTGSE